MKFCGAFEKNVTNVNLNSKETGVHLHLFTFWKNHVEDVKMSPAFLKAISQLKIKNS